MEAAAAHLLNFSQPFDCSLLEQIVMIAMDGNHPQRAAANEFLVRMKEHPDMWRRADAILEMSKDPATKFFGLQVLTEAINTHWKVIPLEQREGIRNYIVMKVVSMSANEESMKQNHSFLGRWNMVLIQILKQDWPHNWPNFISDLVASSKTSESLCENNMKILQLLSEDIFDFSKDTMTAQKIKNMKESLMSDFAQIFQLCEFILEYSQKPSLIVCTLNTLQRFLTWIPFGYIFETNLIGGLIGKFLPKQYYRVATVDCLLEVASLPPADIAEQYRPVIQNMLVNFIQVLSGIIPQPESCDLATFYENANEQDCLFVSRLGLFLGTYLKSFLPFFETPQSNRLVHESAVLNAFWYMIAISKVDDDEIFKACLELWIHFSKEMYTADHNAKISSGVTPNSSGMSVSPRMLNPFLQQPSSSSTNNISTSKHAIYETLLYQLRVVMIDKMAKPEEVIIVEDDNGEIVREQTKDTEVIAQYKTMKETLVYLTNLDSEITETIMLQKLDLQVQHGQFTWNGLNTLCWAIGSISGAMGEVDEKRFLVSVIKDLLRLCEEQRGKDNKAVVASNIMYIVGQYPRFLRAHWKFLKTVVNKLFEFMHELHPGVQDMACDTFLKIAQKCKRKFMTLQTEETSPYVMTLIEKLGDHIKDLQPHQVQSFYESMGTMLSDQGPQITLPRDQVMLRLMELQNQIWKLHMQFAAGTPPNHIPHPIAGIQLQGVSHLFQLEVIKELSKIIKINTKVCQSGQSIYLHQLSFIFQDILSVYRLYGEKVKEAVDAHGPVAVRWTDYKAMRHLKTDVLELFTAAIECSMEGGTNSIELFKATFFPGMTQDILTDFKLSPPQSRDSKVLSLFAQALTTFKDTMSTELPLILETVFEKTLEMITQNMLDYPELRIAFFTFLRHANIHCFYALFSIPPHYQKLLIDSIVWAFKHTERNISETGLEILNELLQNVNNAAGGGPIGNGSTSEGNKFAQSFYSSFFLPLMQDVFGVLTDRLHKSGFVLQSNILMQLFHSVQNGRIQIPLHSLGGQIDNVSFLKDHLSGLLLQTFPNLTKTQVINFVRGLFDLNMDINAFKQHLRDFLIAVKEFATEDNSELFLEEEQAKMDAKRKEEYAYMASVPGLIKPSERDEDDD